MQPWSKQLFHIILDKIEGASRLGVCRWFSRYSRFSCVAREKLKHFIVGKIQDGRHLTRYTVKQSLFQIIFL